MTDKTQRMLDLVDRAVGDEFRSVQLRTECLTPAIAAKVLRRLPDTKGFAPQTIADHVERLPAAVGESVVVGRSMSQAFVRVSIPDDPRRALDWAETLMTTTGATSIKMNLGPDKATDLKAFWGKPEVNTLVEVGGED